MQRQDQAGKRWELHEKIGRPSKPPATAATPDDVRGMTEADPGRLQLALVARRDMLEIMPPRRRKVLVALVAVVVAGLAYAGWLWLAWRPSHRLINRENFKRIEQGMTRKEVEAILGPPGDYRTGKPLSPDFAKAVQRVQQFVQLGQERVGWPY